MLILDPTLAAVQDSASRRPLVEIKSQERVADIPFNGQRLTAEAFKEFAPSVPIVHSTGRLCLAYSYGPDGTVAPGNDSGIKYVYTDASRSEFFEVTIPLSRSTVSQVIGISICEITGGNIGLVYLVQSSSMYYLNRRVITVTGAAVSHAEIASWSSSIFTSAPFVLSKGANDYLLVYAKQSGSDYFIYKRTSADFATWSLEASLSISGLTSTWRLNSPSLLVLTSGEIWIWFDAREVLGPNGEELINVYYSISTDGGVNWAQAVKWTNYATYSEVALHPAPVQKVADEIYGLFTKQVTALHINGSTSGWPPETWCSPDSLQFDPVNRKLYMMNHYNWSFQGVVRVDVDTWTIDKFWTDQTTPGFLPGFRSGTDHLAPPNKCRGAGQYIIVEERHHSVIALLDGEGNTIKNYCWEDDTQDGLACNISGMPTAKSSWEIGNCAIDLTNRRLWVSFKEYNILEHRVIVGYIDMDDAGTGVPPQYAWKNVIDTTLFSIHQASIFGSLDSTNGGADMLILPAEDLIVMTAGFGDSDMPGATLIYRISDGLLWKNYSVAAGFSNYPYHGIHHGCCYYNGKLYGGFRYSATQQPETRGLCEITLATDEIRFYRPDYATLDDYLFRDIVTGSANRLVITSRGYGIVIFDTLGASWSLWNNDNVPGLTTDGSENFWPVVYDAAENFIISGQTEFADQVTMFSEYGFMKQAHYSIGTWALGTWSWTTPEKLVDDYLYHELVAVRDPDTPTSMFVFWTSEDYSEGTKSIRWDKDGSTFDLSPYICKDTDIVVNRSIEGDAYELSFAISHGHLFDPYNLASMFSMYVRKGRKLTIRWGERIAGVNYWIDAGTFFVTETSLQFERGVYSDLKITAQDERCFWADKHIYATAAYVSSIDTDWYPEAVLGDLLQEWAGFTLDRINIPTFEGRILLDYQGIDTTLLEIINRLCNRFGYFFKLSNTNRATAGRISIWAAVNHVYSSKDTLFTYAPEDSYSDFTNKVTVIGTERDFIDVYYPEERVGGLKGTCGWWGFKKDFTIWYSEDKSRQCRYPRLHALEAASSIAFKLAGEITERIEREDTEYKYCVVEVKAPNLIPLLYIGLEIYFDAVLIPDIVITAGFLAQSGITIPLGRIVEKIGLFIVLMVLASVGNYQFDIYAQPMGKVRRSVQGSWEDLEGQSETGDTIEKTLNDDLCYSSIDCTAVAKQELMIVKAQRKRLRISKVAHLQDEEGDMIQIPHPYSGQPIKFFITNLTRRMKIAESANSDGYFIDEMEGWLCE